MSNFKQLFNFIKDDRLRPSSSSRANERSLIIASESDKGRVINAASFRRLQQKAQVFSLETNASVRTRLTHSVEVSQIGRYLAQEIIRSIPEEEAKNITYEQKSAFISIVETACLLHDIGNPPFGHLGEAAIRNWFKKYGEKTKSEDIYQELCNFDGNAQGFRLITYLSGQDEFGLNLTATSILSFVKYPYEGKIKGLFKADYEFSYKKACNLIGWEIGKKFPLAIIMDLADEISYCMSDLEDGLEKRVITKHDLFQELGKIGYPKPDLTDCYPYPFIAFKTMLINDCVKEATKKFIEKLDTILDPIKTLELDEFKSLGSFEKLSKIKDFAKKHIYSDRNVELIELAGAKVISGLLDSYSILLGLEEEAILHLIKKKKPKYPEGGQSSVNLDFELRLINTIPENHIRKYQMSIDYYNKNKSNWNPDEKTIRAQLIVDFISGMTDDFALEMYQFLKGIKIHG